MFLRIALKEHIRVTFTEGSKATVTALWCALAIAVGPCKGFAGGHSNSANLDAQLNSPGAVGMCEKQQKSFGASLWISSSTSKNTAEKNTKNSMVFQERTEILGEG